MEGSYPDWTSLPAEILSKIFHYPDIDRHLPGPYNLQAVSFQVSLVCKAWRNPAQSIIYSHVTINTILQLEKFHDIIKCNNYIGTMVKLLKLHLYDITESYKPELIDIVTNLLSNGLPNLESFYQGYYHSYVPTLNALLDFKLKYLRSIQNPEYSEHGDRINYISCAFLMRDRLQQVYIDDFSYPHNRNMDELTITKFQQLYDNLHQFNNLTTIKIIRKTNDILQLLEYIVESCTSLKDMDVTVMYGDDYVEHNDNIDFDTTTHYIPRANIKTLTIQVNKPQINVPKIFLYIMKKFPNLEELYLRTIKDKLQVAPYAILQLLKHSAKIKKFSLPNLTMNQDDIYEFIENVWNTTSKPGVVNVRLLCFKEHSMEAESTSIIIDKDPEKGIEINFDCHLRFHSRHPSPMDFIEKIGKSIVTLTFEFEGASFGGESSENFLFHIFMHCPNLRNLYIDKGELHKCTQSNFFKINTCSLDKLILSNCELDAGVLEQLSTVLSEVKQLHLLYTGYSNGDDDNGRPIFYINMPQTKIQFFTYCSILGDPTYVKLFTVNDQKYYYYQPVNNDTDSIHSWKREVMISEQIDKSIYDEAVVTEYELLDCCFQTKPEIAFEYGSDYDILLGFQFHYS